MKIILTRYYLLIIDRIYNDAFLEIPYGFLRKE